jgi:hypothetical protein
MGVFKAWIVLISGFLLVVSSKAATEKEARVWGQTAVTNFLSGKLDLLWSQMSPEMTNAFKSKLDFQKFAEDFNAQLGNADLFLFEDLEKKGDLLVFTSLGKYSKRTKPYQFEIAFNPQGKIAGFKLEPGLMAKMQGRAMTAAFYAGKADDLWIQFTPQFKQQMTKQETFRQFVKTTLADLGTETRVVEESDQQAGTYEIYRRVSTFSKYPRAMESQWVFDSNYRIAGFSLAPK